MVVLGSSCSEGWKSRFRSGIGYSEGDSRGPGHYLTHRVTRSERRTSQQWGQSKQSSHWHYLFKVFALSLAFVVEYLGDN